MSIADDNYFDRRLFQKHKGNIAALEVGYDDLYRLIGVVYRIGSPKDCRTTTIDGSPSV